jgi:hypothetical protein
VSLHRGQDVIVGESTTGRIGRITDHARRTAWTTNGARSRVRAATGFDIGDIVSR